MNAATLQRHVQLDRVSLTIGAALLAVTVGAWAIVLTNNAAMDDEPATGSGMPAMDDGAMDGAATEEHMMPDGEMTGMDTMSPREDLRMRIGVSQQMDSWPWPATFAVFSGAWVAMMAGMMFPAAVPMAATYTRTARKTNGKGRAGLLVGLFVTSYILVWGVFGVAVYGLNELAGEAAARWDAVTDAGPYIGGTLLIGAGIYQFTGFKGFCLSKCRSPLGFMLKEWRDGPAGALRMGVKHGLWCLGCCVGLMVGLIVAGVMSIGWMVTLGVLIFTEKVTKWGPQVARVTAVVMAAAGIALIVYGDGLPGMA
ncbi:MAG: DUF2182 domain-containing protein [Chloroflexi bacterium]|nr:DUF2182 domain-containing protein [Chloroflexota bacterium]